MDVIIFLGGVRGLVSLQQLNVLLLLLIEGNIAVVMRAVLERPAPSMWEQPCMSHFLLINR